MERVGETLAALSRQVAEQGERLAAVEAQPVPKPGVVVRDGVAKGEDGTKTGGDPYAGLSADARGLAMLKAKWAQGGQVFTDAPPMIVASF